MAATGADRQRTKQNQTQPTLEHARNSLLALLPAAAYDPATQLDAAQNGKTKHGLRHGILPKRQVRYFAKLADVGKFAGWAHPTDNT